MKKSEQINELATALSKAQGEMNAAVKDASNPFFKSKYADLTSILEACRTPLSKNNLSVIQATEETEKGTALVTMIMHASGQWVSSELRLTPVDQKPQSIGSAMSYARRYALQALLGVPTVEENGESSDDDGNSSSGVNIHTMHTPPHSPPLTMHTTQSHQQPNGHADYRIPFGKYKGRTIEEIYTDQSQGCGPEGLKGYVKFLDNEERKGKLSQPAAECRKQIDNFLGLVETTPYFPEGDLMG